MVPPEICAKFGDVYMIKAAKNPNKTNGFKLTPKNRY
jgi:hypothetical protein